MGKHVLVMTGSPRRGGNSELMALSFAQGARSSGHTVEVFEAAFHKIAGCRACGCCWSKGAPCAFDDDFNTKLAPLLERADALVLSMPLYFYGMPAQVKAPIDRLYAYISSRAKAQLHIRESALLICGSDEESVGFEGALATYRHICMYEGWQDRGVVLCTSVRDKGDVRNTDALARAQALGEGL